MKQRIEITNTALYLSLLVIGGVITYVTLSTPGDQLGTALIGGLIMGIGLAGVVMRNYQSG